MEGAALPNCSPFGLTAPMLMFRLALLLCNKVWWGLNESSDSRSLRKTTQLCGSFAFLPLQVKTSSTVISRRETSISQLLCLRAWCAGTAGLHSTETGGKRATQSTWSHHLHSHWQRQLTCERWLKLKRSLNRCEFQNHSGLNGPQETIESNPLLQYLPT